MLKTIQGYTYKVNQTIGKGYSSTVHKGIKDQTGQDVSIKVIQMAKLQDPINQLLLQYQVSALRALQSQKQVLHLNDVFATKNNTYIITQLCQGDLGSLLKTRKSVPYLQAVDILKQLSIGLKAIHDAGYLHRDIKPANVLYKNKIYKIADFGFAVPKAQLSKHTQYNVGSPVYMSPQALKDNNYSVSSDAWGLGIIFYQMVKGVVPWRAVTQKTLYQKIISQPIQSILQGFPEIAKKFLNKVLHLQISQRLTIQQILEWTNDLSKIEIRTNPPSPLNNNFNKLQSNTPKVFKQQKHMFGRTTLGPCNRTFIPKTNRQQLKLDNIKRDTSETQKYTEISFLAKENSNQDFRQAQFFSHSIICYLKFLHNVIKFVDQPCKYPLLELKDHLSNFLYDQIEYIQNIVLIPIKQIQNWGQYLSTPKGVSFKKNFMKKKSKYKLFHPKPKSYSSLSHEKIKQGVLLLVENIKKVQQFDQKSTISADYLSTLFQLVQLRKKHHFKTFIQLSKIDMIVKGNPYSVSKINFESLIKKLPLIGISS